MKKIIFQENPINNAGILAEVGTAADGAILTFAGRARNFSRGKEVSHLEYEIYESMARKEMEKIVDSALGKWSLSCCVVVHRYGRVAIGEDSIIIALSSPHRDEAYQASRYIIDTIKQTVPIWKKEFYTDGSKWIHDRS
ncbi:MAG: molybdenum cofactor biosynthesis protein MoaE [bacterium]|nr:molybdenum cofactor biosynthesis protein MoaE [bacterium]